jgi:ferredoxin
MPKVTFQNEAITVEAQRGASLKDIAEKAGINLYEGFWVSYHCPGIGLCPGVGCKVWVIERQKDAVSPRTFLEKLRPGNKGSIRLACQTHVLGDLEVRTQPGALLDNVPNMKWDPDSRPSRWKDRLTAKGPAGAADDDEDEADEA